MKAILTGQISKAELKGQNVHHTFLFPDHLTDMMFLTLSYGLPVGAKITVTIEVNDVHDENGNPMDLRHPGVYISEGSAGEAWRNR